MKRATAVTFLLALALVSTLLGWQPRSPAAAADAIYKFKISEDHLNYAAVGDPSIYLMVETVAIYGCMNYEIDTNVAVAGNVISVTLGPISKPNICLTALGPATSRQPLALAEGVYNLTVQSSAGTDSFTVTVTQDAITIESQQASVALPEASRYYRFPANSFAYYCGTLFTDEHFCSDFSDRLTNAVALQSISVPPDGVWPYQLSSEGHYYDAPALFFRYADADTWQQVTGTFQDFVLNTLKDRCGAGLSVVNWRNESYNSWLLVQPTCQGGPAPTATPRPTAAPDPTQSPAPASPVVTPSPGVLGLPNTGGTPESTGGALAWRFAVAFVAGVALITMTALRRHTRR